MSDKYIEVWAFFKDGELTHRDESGVDEIPGYSFDHVNAALDDIWESVCEKFQDMEIPGEGTVTVRVRGLSTEQDPGQYGDEGRCEIAPYWDIEDVELLRLEYG